MVTVKGKVDAEHPDGMHIIPSDSRFKDEEYLPKGDARFKSKNGKQPGGILITTPTTSTSEAQHHTSFTHHVGPETIEHAKTHNGEYEIDNPYEQENARGKLFVQPNQQKIITTIGSNAQDPSAPPAFLSRWKRQRKGLSAAI
jgi:hypothetical protein